MIYLIVLYICFKSLREKRDQQQHLAIDQPTCFHVVWSCPNSQRKALFVAGALLGPPAPAPVPPPARKTWVSLSRMRQCPSAPPEGSWKPAKKNPFLRNSVVLVTASRSSRPPVTRNTSCLQFNNGTRLVTLEALSRSNCSSTWDRRPRPGTSPRWRTFACASCHASLSTPFRH